LRVDHLCLFQNVQVPLPTRCHSAVSQDYIMLSIRKATSADFDEVYSSLLVQFKNPYLTREDYQGLFRRQWESAEDWHGFVLVDNSTIVGFLGLVHSTRLIRGTERRFCNLSHWIVKTEFRGARKNVDAIPPGLLLILEAMTLPECTLTSFTPTKAVTPIYERLLWTELDHRCHVILALPYLGVPRSRGRLIYSRNEISARLRGEERKIFRDHEQYKCGHIYIEDGGSGCYVVFTRVMRKRLPFVLVHYIGNVPIFMRNIGRIRYGLCLRQRAIGLLVDERFLRGGRIFGSFIYEGEKRFFRTTGALDSANGITRDDVDSLYSEYIVVNV